MKTKIFSALILLSPFIIPPTTFAGGPGGRTQTTKKSQLGTSFKFNGAQLRGKYQSSLNTSATVENDKLLEDLLKGRTDFSDRLDEEKERN